MNYLFEDIERRSVQSEHRYTWFRSIPENPWDNACTFVMLNPSTADEYREDPTVRRCWNFAKDWGYGSLYVLNLFTYRSTDPKKLMERWKNDEPLVGSGDSLGTAEEQMIRCASASNLVVCAWGAIQPAFHLRALEVIETLKPVCELHALRFTKDGHPCHPLYLPGHLKPVLFETDKYLEQYRQGEYVVYCKNEFYNTAHAMSAWPTREEALKAIDEIIKHPKNADMEDLENRLFVMEMKKKAD